MSEYLRRFLLGLLYTTLWSCCTIAVAGIAHWASPNPAVVVSVLLVAVMLVAAGYIAQWPFFCRITTQIPAAAAMAAMYALSRLPESKDSLTTACVCTALISLVVAKIPHEDIKTYWERAAWLFVAAIGSGLAVGSIYNISDWAIGAAILITMAYALSSSASHLADS